MLNRSVYVCAMCLLGVTCLVIPLLAEADDPPQFRYIPPQTAYEDEVFILDLSQFIWFYPNGSGGNLSYSDDSPLVETDPVTGLLVWDTPEDSHVGEHFITVTATDELGRTAQQEIKIEVPHDCLPYWFPFDCVQHLIQGVPFRLNASVEVCDYCYEDGIEFIYTNDNQDLFVIDPHSGLIEFTPTNEQVGNWSVTITVTDGEGERDSTLVKFIVTNINDPPRLVPLDMQVMTEGEPYSLKLMANDPDLETRLVDADVKVDRDEALTFEGGLHGWEVNPVTGVFNYTPTNDDARNRTLSVTFNITDAYGGEDSMVVVFRVVNVEQPPLVQVVGIVDDQILDRNHKVSLMAVTKDEWGEDWGVQFLWYMDDKYLGEGKALTWKPPYDGKGRTRLRLVVVNETNHRIDTSVNVTLTEGSTPDPMTRTIYWGIGVSLILTGAVMIATLVVRRRADMRGPAEGHGPGSEGGLVDRRDDEAR